MTSTHAGDSAVPIGRPAGELSDEDLERQGKAAHETRNWVFLNGTAEQFAHHTARMLELEQEYLHRHPKRTWQGSGGAADGAADVEVLVQALRSVGAQVERALEQHARRLSERGPAPVTTDPAYALLTRVAEQPGGRLHKLEVHQSAREAGLDPTSLARLYTADPPLLTTEHHDRVITDAGRELLARTPTRDAGARTGGQG